MGFFDRVGRFIDDVLLLPDEVREALEAADLALEQENFDEAERLFVHVLGDRPTLARAAVGLAQAREGLGDTAGVLSALREARELVPEDPEVATWAARVALEHGDLTLASSSARTAARAFAAEGGPRLAQVCAIAAWIEWRRGRPDRAARELRKAVAEAPENQEYRVALVEALVEAGERGAATTAALGLNRDELSPADATRIARALIRLSAWREARPLLESAAARGDVAARTLVARDVLQRGDAQAAETLARAAVAAGGGVEALRVLGAVLAAQGDRLNAADAFAAAAHSSRELTDVQAALRIAPRTEDGVLSELAAQLSDFANEPLLVAARGWSDPDVEMQPALDAGEPFAFLVMASRHLKAGEPQLALDALDHADRLAHVAWAELDQPLVDELRHAAYQARWLNSVSAEGRPEVDLAAAIDAVAEFADTQRLESVARRARQLRDELDRPLLLAVLGEFNAGKSTLINAFIGAGVAPMGIVPTTATLNVLRGGAQRLVRLVFRNGSTREGPHERLREMLAQAEAQSLTGDVDRVEITLPSETLEKVWILDAPGTNALDPAHERLAQEAARRADAVLWVFDAAQAGKLSETKMHARLRQQGRRVVPVLNKRDRLKPGELDEVSAVVEAGFGAPPTALSAKQALAARIEEDAQAYAASGFPELLAYLESEIFSQSRSLKRAACAGRLVAAIDEALEAERTSVDQARQRRAEMVSELEKLQGQLPDLQLALDDALRLLDRDLDAGFLAAADEVLAFVRPRRHSFATHGAHREDRVFLADVLERQLHTAVQNCERRLMATLRGHLGSDGEDHEVPWEASLRQAILAPLAIFWGYQRGLLAGGALRRFFDDVLPHAELEREPLAAALARSRADIDAELRPALTGAVEELHGELLAHLQARIEAIQRASDRLSGGVFGPLRALRAVLAEIAGIE